VTLALPDGQGVAEVLRGPLLAGRAHLHPRRWQLTLGVDERDEPVTLLASQLNVAVCGGSGDGKSYLAGLICEQLVRLGYSLIVSDPEGDHVGLGELRDVLVTGATSAASPTPPKSCASCATATRPWLSTCPTSTPPTRPFTWPAYPARSKPNGP
jgi:Helicase HerA, central domain